MAHRRTTRGNALTVSLREYLLDFYCFEDDFSQTWPKSQQLAEAERLRSLNNTQFRKAFIDRYGKEWWDQMLDRH